MLGILHGLEERDEPCRTKRSVEMTFSLPFRMAFSSKPYVTLAIVMTAGFWVIFNSFDQLLFFSPVLAFYLPDDAVPCFILSNITAPLRGIVVSMNVYVFRHSNLKFGASFFSGSTLGVISSTCASCSSAGFFLVTTFGIA